jgi:hypothetical protein
MMKLRRAIPIVQTEPPAGPCSTCYWRQSSFCIAHNLGIRGSIVAVGCATHQTDAPLFKAPAVTSARNAS